MSSRPHKTAQVWKTLRPFLKDWARAAGYARLQSSPPAYAKEVGEHHVTVFAQGSSGGVDRDLGGTFTLNLQKAQEPQPQVHISDTIVHTKRVPQLFTEAQRDEALAIHNAVVGKRTKPREGSYLYSIHTEDALEAKFLRPLASLPPLDYWMAFVDEDDIAAWGAFFERHLDGWVSQAA